MKENLEDHFIHTIISKDKDSFTAYENPYSMRYTKNLEENARRCQKNREYVLTHPEEFSADFVETIKGIHYETI